MERESVLLLILLAYFASIGPSVALPCDCTSTTGTWPCCNFNCPANDLVVERLYLGDLNGNPLFSACQKCTPGTTINAYIWATFYNNANAERKAVIVLGDLYINGIKYFTFCPQGYCVLDSIAGKTRLNASLFAISYKCGDDVVIKNVYLSWETAAGITCASAKRDCQNRQAKCYYGADVPVDAPLFANFTATSVCYSNSTAFTDKTTGGKKPYTYQWQFGDSGTSTLANPTHHYASAGTYTVTLTVLDSHTPTACTDTVSKTVTVYSTNADLRVSKVANKTIATFGDTIQYQVTISNQGSVDFTNVQALDSLTGTSWTIPTLNAGQSNVKLINYHITSQSLCNKWINNTVAATADARCFNKVGPVFGRSAVFVYCPTDLNVTKVASPTEAGPGENVTFTINVTNAGIISLPVVRVIDVLPVGMTYVSDNRSGVVDGSIITWSNLGPLGPGSSTFIELIAKIFL